MKRKLNLVLGSNYGDEGKGQTCYNLARSFKSCLSILTNGGCQRGHTVVNDNNISHVFQHFGSATRSDLDYNYFSKKFILNPIMFKIEYEALISKNIISKDYNNIWFNNQCIFTTPFDMMANQIYELKRGENRHGSTGLGIFVTIARYRDMHNYDLINKSIGTTLSFDKFMTTYTYEEAEGYLYEIRDYYLKEFKKQNIKLEETDYFKPFMAKFTIEHFLDDCLFMYKKMKALPTDSNILYEAEIIANTNNVIYENGQGLLLNCDETNVHTTPSCTDINYLVDALSKNKKNEDEIELNIYYITRPYITRHGAGPVNSKKLVNFKSDDKTNIPNPWQGTIEYYELDINDLKNRLIKSFSFCSDYINDSFKCIPNLVITHNDEMDREEEFSKTFNNLGWNLIFDRNKH